MRPRMSRVLVAAAVLASSLWMAAGPAAAHAEDRSGNAATQPSNREDHRRKPGDHHRRAPCKKHGDHHRREACKKRRHGIRGEIVEAHGHTFTMKTRHGTVRVNWDEDTRFRNGDAEDLDPGARVAVFGRRAGGEAKVIHARGIAFPKRES
jgi:hypothetical protein